MSYVCLAVSKKGAAASGDTRITILTPFPFLQLHHDFGRKVFSSGNHRTIWACTGITSWFFLRYTFLIKEIMKNEKVPIKIRVDRVSRMMCRFTRAPFWTRLPLLRKLPLVRKSPFAKGFTFNLLYAHEDSPFVCESICFQNGRIVDHKRYKTPIILENGPNRRELTPLSGFHPDADASLAQLQAITNRRVKESIQKDKELKKKDRRYLATIGGRVLTELLIRS